MMDMEVALNKSGYFDDTANKAINHIMKEEADAKEGDIWSLEDPSGPFEHALILKSCEDFCEVVFLRRKPFFVRDCEIDDFHFDASRIAYVHKKKLLSIHKHILPEEFRRCMVTVARTMHFDVHLKGAPEQILKDKEQTGSDVNVTELCDHIKTSLSEEIKGLMNASMVERSNNDIDSAEKLLAEEHDARVKAETEAKIYKQLNETLMKKLVGDVA